MFLGLTLVAVAIIITLITGFFVLLGPLFFAYGFPLPWRLDHCPILGPPYGALPSIGGLSLLTCSSTQLSSAVCFWCMQGIELDTDPISDYQLLSDVKASTAPWCNCVMSSTNALLPFTYQIRYQPRNVNCS